MYKYGITWCDWRKPFSILVRKINEYVLLTSNDDTVCIANAIVDLCNDRDNCSFHMLNKLQLHNIINVLCIG